jgi:hypothetical protein
VEFLAVDKEINEVLVGRILLAASGFDLTSHLEKVFDQVDNMDSSSDVGLAVAQGRWLLCRPTAGCATTARNITR